MKKDKQNMQITDHKEGKNIIASSSETQELNINNFSIKLFLTF